MYTHAPGDVSSALFNTLCQHTHESPFDTHVKRRCSYNRKLRRNTFLQIKERFYKSYPLMGRITEWLSTRLKSSVLLALKFSSHFHLWQNLLCCTCDHTQQWCHRVLEYTCTSLQPGETINPWRSVKRRHWHWLKVLFLLTFCSHTLLQWSTSVLQGVSVHRDITVGCGAASDQIYQWRRVWSGVKHTWNFQPQRLSGVKVIYRSWRIQVHM